MMTTTNQKERSKRVWPSSVREGLSSSSSSCEGGDVTFGRSWKGEDEEELKLGAIEWLHNFDDGVQRGILKEDGTKGYKVVDVTNLGVQDKNHLVKSILGRVEDDEDEFIHKIRRRINT